MPPLDPAAYPPAVAELLKVLPLAPLGPGVPDRSVRDRLSALTDASFGGAIADRDMAACCRAGLWLAFNFLDESHRISQENEGHPSRDYWHALMHRREPDHPNAAYWFRRVGTHPVFEPLRDAAAELAASSPPEAAFLARQTRWDPFAFNDLCAANSADTAPAHDLCRRVQRAEWELLFAWCFDRAVGRSGPRS
jgi:hypothetical protein